MKYHAKTGKFLWLWIPVTTASSLVGIVSGFVGGFIIALCGTAIPRHFLEPGQEGILVGSLLGGALIGTIIGISQGLVLRKYFPRIRYWIIASIFYSTISFQLIVQSRHFWLRNDKFITVQETFWQSIISGLVVGTIAGIVQWFALIAQFPEDSRWKTVSFVWVLVSPLSMIMSFPFLDFGDFYTIFNGGFDEKTILFVGGLAIYSTLTGLALLWLIKQRRTSI
ncbi:hypothetical protein Cylst_0113 [Cylindrospermum stagnale PCC 7417]|uniref:Uncharacterized protein n=1 Tax=Cylindrospermum stagnale PCC 7417 TaxID=56107 RepID=K9WQ27_9NOST|nr:hypothetical protein [Cylindrospermum stagnale]AFZ22490.1 hypothetical protein Cylst_0113 [Cylindrospermum stagnale PCC 7417]